MLLIKVKNKTVLDLDSLFRFALESIFAGKTMTPKRRGMMQFSIIWWSKKVFLLDIHKHTLQRIAWHLDRDNRGGFDRRKDLFIKHKINWRKAYRKLFYDELGTRIY